MSFPQQQVIQERAADVAAGISAVGTGVGLWAVVDEWLQRGSLIIACVSGIAAAWYHISKYIRERKARAPVDTE